MKKTTRSMLINLAAKLVVCNRIDDPDEFCLSLPKSTPKRAVRQIYDSLERASMASKDAAIRIREIIDLDENDG